MHMHWSLKKKCDFQHVSLSLAVPVGWTDTFPCETLQAAVMLRFQWSSFRHAHLALLHLLTGLCLPLSLIQGILKTSTAEAGTSTQRDMAPMTVSH